MKLALFAAAVLALCPVARAEELTPREIYDLRAKSVVMVTAVETVPQGLVNRTKNLFNPFPVYKIPGRIIGFVVYPIVVIFEGPLKAGGSGVIVDAEGHFVTNQHVIDDADVFWATMEDGSLIRADVVGSDELEDLALLKMRLAKEQSVEPAPLGQYSEIARGDSVYAIGSPLRLQDTLTRGIVSAKGRRIMGPFQDFIQTDLTIGVGSSGGPLFSEKGEVVGITSAMFAVVEKTGGLTFSIPVDVVQAALPQLKEHGTITRGFIGVQIKDVTPRIVDELKLKTQPRDGAVIYKVTSSFFGSPAAKTGLKRGDIIIKYDGIEIDNARTLARLVLATKPSTAVPVVYIRGEEERTATIDVQER